MYNYLRPAFIEHFNEKNNNLPILSQIKKDIIINLSALLNGRSKNNHNNNNSQHLLKSGLSHGEFDLATKMKSDDYKKSYIIEEIKEIIGIFEPRLNLIDIFHMNNHNQQASPTVFKILILATLNVLSNNEYDFNIQTELDLQKKICTFSESIVHE